MKRLYPEHEEEEDRIARGEMKIISKHMRLAGVTDPENLNEEARVRLLWALRAYRQKALNTPEPHNTIGRIFSFFSRTWNHVEDFLAA